MFLDREHLSWDLKNEDSSCQDMETVSHAKGNVCAKGLTINQSTSPVGLDTLFESIHSFLFTILVQFIIISCLDHCHTS